MNDWTDEQIGKALRKALASHPPAELGSDLWPRMLRRLDQRPAARMWLDWVLLALLAAWCLIFPGTIPGLVYHL